MKILHFYAKTDKTARRHIEVLTAAMCADAENMVCSGLRDFRKQVSRWQPDIVHLHGCWHLSIARAGNIALRTGARVVVTPHGQLEPWVMKQKYWTDKLPKLLIYQRRCIRRAYSVITQGRMEAGYLKRLGYNTRIETVLNSHITDTISDQEMARQIYCIYKKVLDSDVMELMSQSALLALRGLIKAGITGDARWLDSDELDACEKLNAEEMRKIEVFAYQENIVSIICDGIAATGLTDAPPFPDVVESYTPPFSTPTPTLFAAGSQGDEENIIAAITSLKKSFGTDRLAISHLIELASMLRHCDIDEDKLLAIIRKKRLGKHTARLMNVLADMTGLEEGFMPTPARNDRKARRMRETLNKHIKK